MKDGWVTKTELSKIPGISIGTIRRLLRDGKCESSSDDRATSGGTQTVVLINPYSLPKEYLEKYIAYHVEQEKNSPDSDLNDYATWQIHTAIERRAQLQSIRNKLAAFKDKKINKGKTTDYLSRLCIDERVTMATFYRRDKAEKEGGLVALVPGWGKKNGHLKDFSAEQKQYFISVYGDQSQPKVVECHRLLCDYSGEKGLPLPTISTIRRFVNSLPVNFKDLFRRGPTYYQNKHEYHALRDYSGLKSNDVWCSDHHQLNIYVKDRDGYKGFPWFTVWQDMASRKINGYYLQVRTANSRTIAGAFRHAVLRNGIPEKTYIDNGKDYRSRLIAGGSLRKRKNTIGIDAETQGIFMELGVTPIYAWPYHPQSKPTERFFRTLDEQFSKKFEGYRGRNIANRPEQLNEHVKNGKVMEIAELENLLNIYLFERYNRAPHGGDGMEGRSPDLAFQDKLDKQRTLSNPAVLDLLMMPVERKKVGRMGVTLFGGKYYHADMFLYKGSEVDIRYDPRDLSKILVFERNGKKICIAVNQERMSWNPSKEDIEKIQGIRKEERTALKKVYQFARDKTDLPTLQKRIKAGHNSYAGPEGSVDRKKTETEKTKTRFDKDMTQQDKDITHDDQVKGNRRDFHSFHPQGVETTEDRAPHQPSDTEAEDDVLVNEEPSDWKTFNDEEEGDDE